MLRIFLTLTLLLAAPAQAVGALDDITLPETRPVDRIAAQAPDAVDRTVERATQESMSMVGRPEECRPAWELRRTYYEVDERQVRDLDAIWLVKKENSRWVAEEAPVLVGDGTPELRTMREERSVYDVVASVSWVEHRTTWRAVEQTFLLGRPDASGQAIEVEVCDDRHLRWRAPPIPEHGRTEPGDSSWIIGDIKVTFAFPEDGPAASRSCESRLGPCPQEVQHKVKCELAKFDAFPPEAEVQEPIEQGASAQAATEATPEPVRVRILGAEAVASSGAWWTLAAGLVMLAASGLLARRLR